MSVETGSGRAKAAIDARRRRVTAALKPGADGFEAALGAAYLMTDRAYVRLDGDPARQLTVQLAPKGDASVAALKALAAAFLAELDTQRVRWAVAKNNLPVREYIAEHAVRLAQEGPPAPPAVSEQRPPDELTDAQRTEIEKLIAEVEDEIREMNETRSAGDPKNISASWEQKHEEKQQEPKA